MDLPRKFLSKKQLSWYMDIPFYYGKEDKYSYANWESYIEDFFASYKLSEEEMYYCARWKMGGEARRWWHVYGKGCQFWYQMKAELQHRYLPKHRTISRSAEISQSRRKSEEFRRASEEFQRASKESIQKLSDMFALYKEQQDAKLELEIQSQSAPKPEHEIKPEIEIKPEPEVEPEHEYELEVEPEHEPEPEIEPVPEIESCIVPEPCIEPEHEIETCIELEPELEHELVCTIESLTAPATELQFESLLHIPPQFVEHIDFIISEPPPLTSQQLLRACLPSSEMYPHESIRLRVYIPVHFKVRGRVFSNTKTLQISCFFSFYHSPGGESFEAEENDRGPEATKLLV